MDKHGWCLTEMLILSSILIIFLFIATYHINRLDSNNLKIDYKGLEKSLANNALIYLNNYYEDNLNSDGITITRNTLKAYNLDIILEENNKPCTGYVRAHKTHGKIYTKSYIKCKNYETNGYEG